jgi:hypothetical protein
LSHDPKATPRFAYAALKNRRYVQAFPDGSQVDMLAFERESRSPRRDTKILDLGKGVDYLFSDAVGEELIFGIRAHISEWQDDNRLMLSPGWHRREGPCLPFTERFLRICVPLHPLQVSSYLRGVLIPQIPIFL